MTKPKYQEIKAQDIPKLTEGNSLIHIIAGEYKQTKGAFISNHVATIFLDVEMKANKNWIFETSNNQTVFIYIIRGSGRFESKNSELIKEKQVILFNEGSKINIYSGDTDLRFLLSSAQALNEPIAWGGPIVMNTPEELEQAYLDLDQGTFEDKSSS